MPHISIREQKSLSPALSRLSGFGTGSGMMNEILCSIDARKCRHLHLIFRPFISIATRRVEVFQANGISSYGGRWTSWGVFSYRAYKAVVGETRIVRSLVPESMTGESEKHSVNLSGAPSNEAIPAKPDLEKLYHAYPNISTKSVSDLCFRDNSAAAPLPHRRPWRTDILFPSRHSILGKSMRVSAILMPTKSYTVGSSYK